MSKEQLVTAYMQGELGQRQLVKRLVALGVSLTAALAYAAVVPSVAHADQSNAYVACQKAADAALQHIPFCGN